MMILSSSSSLSGGARPLPGQTAPSLVRRWATTTTTTTTLRLFLVVLAAVAPLGSDAMMKCGTKTPSRAHQLLDQARMLGLKKRHGRIGRKLLGETCDELPAICDQCVNIPIYVHLLTYPAPPGDSDLEYILPHPVEPFVAYRDDGNVSALEELTTPEMMLSMVQDNVDLTNEVFQGTPFQFTLMADDYTISTNANWTTFPVDYTYEISETLRRGGMESLNLYLAYILCSEDELELDNSCWATGGFAFMPSTQPDDDGIWLLYDTVTGGGYPGADLGYNLVHEIGHWLGLDHTFTNSLEYVGGDPCSDSNTNDFVDDTGVHAGPSQDSYNCTDFLFPDGQVELPDTCPGQELLDPFFNIMNYLSDEVCFEATEAKFTCGQVERMWLQWNLYREFNSTCVEDEMEVAIVVGFDFFVNETTFYLSTVGSSEPIFDSETDFCMLYQTLNSVLVDLCVPRGEEYEYVVRDSFGDGTTLGLDGSPVSPAIILVDGVLECELPADFGSEAKVLFNSSYMDCNGTPVFSSNEEEVIDTPSEPTSMPNASMPTASTPPTLDDDGDDDKGSASEEVGLASWLGLASIGLAWLGFF